MNYIMGQVTGQETSFKKCHHYYNKFKWKGHFRLVFLFFIRLLLCRSDKKMFHSLFCHFQWRREKVMNCLKSIPPCFMIRQNTDKFKQLLEIGNCMCKLASSCQSSNCSKTKNDRWSPSKDWFDLSTFRLTVECTVLDDKSWTLKRSQKYRQGFSNYWITIVSSYWIHNHWCIYFFCRTPRTI